MLIPGTSGSSPACRTSLLNRYGESRLCYRGGYDISSAEEGIYNLTQSTRLKSMSFDAREVILYSSIIFRISVSLDRNPYLGLKTWYNAPQNLDRVLRCMLTCHNLKGGMARWGRLGRIMMQLSRQE